MKEQSKKQPKKPLVYICTPTHDERAYTRTFTTHIEAMKSQTVNVDLAFLNSSALCKNYNELWCTFWNACKHQYQSDEEPDLTYFCMVHSDLQAALHPLIADGKSWLDYMVQELEANDLSMLAVVNAMKSRRGLTSLACGMGDHNQRPLSLQEIHRLGFGETFTDDEFKEKTGCTMLVNTGIVLIKPDPRWADQFGFEFRDRVVLKNGVSVAEADPEDWNMSRWFRSMNIKYGATTGVKTLHFGNFAFPSWDDGSGLYTY